jgi:hypothetical protein
VGARPGRAAVTRRKTRHGEPCGALGPDVRASAQYVRPAQCNRVRGHEALDDPAARDHAERDPQTFALLATWAAARDVGPGRRKIR